jgi:hypothetical protein
VLVLQVVENVLAECGQDIDAAIRRLNQLKLSTEQGGQQAPAQSDTATAPENTQQAHVQIDALVQEMAAAKDMEDARSRAGKLLQAFEQFVTAPNKAEVSLLWRQLGDSLRIECIKCLTRTLLAWQWAIALCVYAWEQCSHAISQHSTAH